MKTVELEKIRIDGGTQVRYQLDWFAVSEYAQAMQDGAEFPPIVLFQNGDDGYWLADGFHRVQAALKIERTDIAADVRSGGKREAILYAVGANADHGVRRTNADKRRAVTLLLADEEWRQWPLNEISRTCCVSVGLVHKIHQELSFHDEKIEKPTTRKVTRKGKTYTQDTTNIGKRTEPKPEPQPDLLDSQPTPITAPEHVKPPMPEPSPVVEPIAPIRQPVITLHNADSRHMLSFDVAPVHLVITSPPYNVGIDYGISQDDLRAYTELITDIWQECFKAMVDGGRIAVVVPFGVGRNPWVPMAARVCDTLIGAGFTLRGQIIWDKNTTGNRTSWGSFRLPSDPSLRDTSEAIIIAHKGSGKLELPAEVKATDDKGSHTAWLASSDYFMQLAQDHWTISPESAQRVKHPAPFPVELVTRLIHFYAFPGAHVLDPFAGSGTVGVAAKRLGCDATLFEMDSKYCEIARTRIND